MPLKLKRYVVLLLALFLINIPIEKQGVVIPADIYYKKGDKYYVYSNGKTSSNELCIRQIIKNENSSKTYALTETLHD